MMKCFRNGLLAGLAFLLLGSGMISCDQMVPEDPFLNDRVLSDLELMELAIVPCKPGSEDVISVIEKICGTESGVELRFEGNLIGYRRYMNSLIMAPCSPVLDTTILGQLPEGTYELVHTVIDRNHLLSDSIVLQDTIALVVNGWSGSR